MSDPDFDSGTEHYASPESPSSPLARALTSFFSAGSSFFSEDFSESQRDRHQVTPVPHELIAQFLSELDIRFPSALDALKATGEIKRADPAGPTLFAARVLRAQKLDIKSAVERADEHARWRQETLSGGVMEFELTEDMAPQVNENKVFLVLNTSSSRPCLIVRVTRHTAGLTKSDVLKKYIVYCMELAVYLCDAADNPDGKIDVVFDARGMKWANYDVNGLKSVFQILEKRFFERIHVIYMYDGPRLLDMLWKIVRPFVDEHTREKIQFLSGKETEQLLNELGKEYMPDDFLGVPIHKLADKIKSEGMVRLVDSFGPSSTRNASDIASRIQHAGDAAVRR